MHTPGELAALYDDLAKLHDDLVSREETKRAELAPLRGYIGYRGPAASLHDFDRCIAAIELLEQISEDARIRDLLALLLDRHQDAALRSHTQAMHSAGSAP
jgi:hypothetical protein